MILLGALAWLSSLSAPEVLVRQGLAEAQTEILAEAPDDDFGWSVADAGDVNGDGFRDVLVGAIYNDSAASNAGKAYVFLGGPTLRVPAFVTMTGLAANEQFGVSVAGAGDVNGDGFADVVVGARLNGLAAKAAGAAFLYLGGTAMDGSPDVILLGEAANDWFGNSVAGAGDVDHDGYADVLVGAPYSDRGGSASGAAYVFRGGPAMNAAPDVVLAGEIHDDQFGWSVGGAGDVDGDGFSDVLVGARMHCVDSAACPGASYARGRAYVFRGGSAMDATADLVLDGTAANDWFGNTVAGIGDVDGDGFDDVAIGAIYADPVVAGIQLNAAGTTSVVFGSSPPSGARTTVLPGEQANSQSGWAIAKAGGMSGQGRGGFWTTAHFYDDGSNTGAGKASLFTGGPSIGPWPAATVVGEETDVHLGQSVAGADVSGFGGLAEAVLGQVYSRRAGAGSGKAYVLSPFCLTIRVERTDLHWESCSPFSTYDVYRGSIRGDLPAGAYGACLQAGVTGSSASLDAAVPSSGDGFFYLVTGRSPSLEGGLGFTSSGTPRPNASPCP